MYKTLGTDRHKILVKLLIEARQNSGLTQTELAELLGEYQSFVARLESGQRRIDVVEFVKLTEVIGIEPTEIIAKISAMLDD